MIHFLSKARTQRTGTLILEGKFHSQFENSRNCTYVFFSNILKDTLRCDDMEIDANDSGTINNLLPTHRLLFLLLLVGM